MARPPGPTQKRYRGNPRHNMRSAANHLLRLFNLDTKYRARPAGSYPNQLYDLGTAASVNQFLILLGQMLGATGPIPNRV